MKNKYIVILAIIAVIMIIITLIIAQVVDSKKQFLKPEFDSNAINITNENIAEELQYAEINVEEGYTVGLCNNLVLDSSNNIKICFSSLKENTVYVKLRIYDKNEELIKETGLLKPGEQIEKINADNIKETKDVTIKIMSYDPDTYYSRGTVTLNTKIKIGDI